MGSGLPATGFVSVALWTIVGTLASGTIKNNDYGIIKYPQTLK